MNTDAHTEGVRFYFLKRNYQLLNYLKKFLIILCIFFGSNYKLQLVPTLIFQVLWIIGTVILRPYRSQLQLLLKFITDIILLACIGTVFYDTQLQSQLLGQSTIAQPDLDNANYWGWVAAALLCTFNILSLIFSLVNTGFYIRDFMTLRQTQN
jgi:hypothetical protein